MPNKPLKYLFTATFEDGTVLVQTLEDKSILDPEKRNTWYDLLQMQKTKKLTAFVLKGEGHEYGVDLRDGHFEIDSVPFWMHEVENKDIDPMDAPNGVQLSNFRIVFFMTNRRSFTAVVGPAGMSPATQSEHTRVFRFGWQATDAKGKNYQQIMQID